MTRASGRCAATALVLALILRAVAAAGAEIEGVVFADRIRVHGVPLVVAGVGLLRWKVIFRGYVAALYLGEGARPGDWPADVPKRLEIEYFWAIAGSAFGKGGDEVLSHNVSPETMASLRDRLDRIAAMYPDVRPGDRLSLTYLPALGSELAWNGKPLGTIAGADFASAYFAIWLGAAPMSASLRDQLLGRR